MKLSRRTLLGSFLAVPFVRSWGSGQTLKARKVNNLLTLNGQKLLAPDFVSMTNVLLEEERRSMSCLTFRAPLGAFRLGQDISVRWNGNPMFKGAVRTLTVVPQNLVGNPLPFLEVEAVDYITFNHKEILTADEVRDEYLHLTPLVTRFSS